MWRKEVRLAGSGGQGLGLAATVLADAALKAGLYATILQSYGPEARGGASRSDLTLSDQEIMNPWFDVPAVLLVLNAKAWEKFSSTLGSETQTIVDRDQVEIVDSPEVFQIAFERIAKGELREKVVANMVAVGALGVMLKRIPREILADTAQRRAPRGYGEINRLAVLRGWEIMEQDQGGADRGRITSA